MAEQFSSRLEPLLSLVTLYSQTKNYQNVVNTLNRLEELDGKSEQTSMEKARMYLLMDNKEKAFAEIESLSKEYPYELRYRTMLGDMYLDNGKVDDALAVYQHILREDPGYAPAVLSMASYYQKTKQDSLYRLQLDTILLNDDVLSDTKMNIMRQLIMLSEQTTKDSTQIVQLFQNILKRPQQNADIAMLCAQYMITKHMDKESVPVLHKVLELDPENKPARLQLLSYAIRNNNLDEMIRIAKPALEYNPDALEFYYYLGIAYYQKEDTDEALNVFMRGIKQIDDKSDKQIAVIPIGYADGFDRRLGNGNGEVLVGGKRCKVVGNICMDLAMIDVTNTDCSEGDEVIIFGDELTLTEIADKLGTISYEVLTGISRRVKRVYFQE